MKKLIVLLILVVRSSLCASPETLLLEQKIERAFYRAEASLLAEAQAELGTALQKEPGSAALKYLQGLAAYTEGSLGYVAGDKKAVGAGLDKADTILASIKGGAWEIEARGLRGLIAGELINVRGGGAAMSLGPKMMTLTSAAYEDAPENGRILMFHGVTLLSTPGIFGGDVDEGVRLLERAVAAFDRAKKDGDGLVWGEANAWFWLGQGKVKQGDLAGARIAAEKALILETDFRAVRVRLLRGIDKKAAKKS